MLGMFGLFGRAHDLRQFERALHGLDLHPRLVPDAVKIAAVRLLRAQAAPASPDPSQLAEAAALLAYCMIGAEGFAGANNEELALAVERRIEAALDAGDSLDARLILLTLHSGVIQPSVVAQFALEAAER